MTPPANGDDVDPRKALVTAQRALAKVNRVNDLEDEIEQLREDVTAVERRLAELDDVDGRYEDNHA